MVAPGRFTEALLLRAVDYGESDRIVTLLTRDLGKIAVMARGARKSSRRFGGALQAYALIRAEVSLGRGEVGRLAQAQVVRAHPRILADLGKMTLAGAALELVREIAPPREPDDRLFEVAHEVLAVLDVAESAREEILLAFSIRVMSLAGFEPGLDVCARCGKRAPEGRAAEVDPALGSIVCRACGGGPVHLCGGARARMRQGVGSGWADADFVWPSRELSEVRRAVAEHVRAHVGRVLRGPDLLAQVGELDRERSA